MNKTITVLALAALLGGCNEQSPTTSDNRLPSSAKDSERLAEAERRPADNTGKNARDDGSTVTPVDQGQNSADVEITKTIRSTITGRDGMSFNARNVKIVTRDRVVTLRGPVDTPEERQFIVATANAVAGVTRVDDQLEIAKR